MRKRCKGFGLVEVIIVVVVVVAIGILLAWKLGGDGSDGKRKRRRSRAKRAREEERKMRCRSNLRVLGIAMVQYIDNKGDQRYYPWPGGGADFDGAEWLAALYWSKVLTEPAIYLCPSALDDNNDGADLGDTDRVGIPDGAVSYAAKGKQVSPVGPGGERRTITDIIPGDTVMASDDSECWPNHGSGFTVLFFDGHVEFLTDLDVESSVGLAAPLDTICN